MHTPDPTAMSGTLETTNTGGGQHEHLTGVTRVFHHAVETAQNVVAELLHHGKHAEAVSVPDAPAQFVPEDSDSDASGVMDTTPGGPDEKAAQAPQEPAQDAADPEPSPESPDAAETPAEDAPAAPKTTRKRAAAKPAQETPAADAAAPEAAAQ